MTGKSNIKPKERRRLLRLQKLAAQRALELARIEERKRINQEKREAAERRVQRYGVW